LSKFERNVKDKVDEIAAKYILTDEGTYDFALMYIPSENVYYQTIIKEDMQIDGKSIAEYAVQKRIVVVSPNSIYAYLRVICFGLRGMQVEKNVRKIMDDFGRLNQEFGNFATEFDRLGTHLTHASDTFGRADKQLKKFSSRLTLISETTEVGEAKALE
jgi:DNA recombination protein RmuC